ncbi:CUF1-dependent copper transporter 1 [Drosophila ficusphila]|uniref:CUF1-dependent copper transporter 1 n=1 Tax=Drosophila ficusphila TaxID=30025 RepID=UPI0007E8569A|nr:CUF1-dependent copper transporter 1 [Drosophila ficusphila]
MDHHGADASEGHVHHSSHDSPGSDPPSSGHEGHHSPAMAHHSHHAGDKHANHGEGGGDEGGHHMSMFFHTGDAETILFQFWRTESVLALTLSCLLIFLVAVLYEALKFFREWLFARNRRRLQGGRGEYNPPPRYREANYDYNQPTYPRRSSQQSGTQIYAYRPRSPSMPPLQHSGHGHGHGHGSPPNQSSMILTPPTHHHVQQDGQTAGEPRIRLKAWCSRMHLLQTLLHVLQVLISFLLMLVFMTFNVWLCLAVLLGAGVGYYAFCAFGTRVNEHCN